MPVMGSAATMVSPASMVSLATVVSLASLVSLLYLVHDDVDEDFWWEGLKIFRM